MADVLAKISVESRRSQSQSVFDKVVSHPRYKQARSLSIYLSTDQEVDTISLLRQALEVDKKECFIPYIAKTTNGATCDERRHLREPRMQMIELTSMEQYNGLPVNRYGIKEPHADFAKNQRRVDLKENISLDLIIVPGVAFARDGRRLGHGKGYYDEFLAYLHAHLPSDKRPYTLGTALREQIIDDPLAVSGQDFPLDEIVSAS